MPINDYRNSAAEGFIIIVENNYFRLVPTCFIGPPSQAL